MPKEGKNVVLTPETKKEIIDRFRLHDKDTGSPEVQVAILSNRISYLTDHFKRPNSFELIKGEGLPLRGFPSPHI